MEATDTVDNKINVSGPDVFLGRKTAGEGGHEELTIAGLPAETTPASGDLLLIEVGGVLSKLDIADLPGGSAPTLQAVTDAGAVTTNSIETPTLKLSNPGFAPSRLTVHSSADDFDYILPNAPGYIKLGITYQVYTALISQSGTSAPTETELENTLGSNITWARTGAGTYTGTLTGAFTSGKTALFFPGNVMDMVRTSADVITITSAGDGAITSRAIEIRVYP